MSRRCLLDFRVQTSQFPTEAYRSCGQVPSAKEYIAKFELVRSMFAPKKALLLARSSDVTYIRASCACAHAMHSRQLSSFSPAVIDYVSRLGILKIRLKPTFDQEDGLPARLTASQSSFQVPCEGTCSFSEFVRLAHWQPALRVRSFDTGLLPGTFHSRDFARMQQLRDLVTAQCMYRIAPE